MTDKEYKEELERRIKKLEACKSKCGGCTHRDICKDEEQFLKKELQKTK